MIRLDRTHVAIFNSNGTLRIEETVFRSKRNKHLDLSEAAQRDLFDALKEKLFPPKGPFIICGFSNSRGVVYWHTNIYRWDKEWHTAARFETKAEAEAESKKHGHGVVSYVPLSAFHIPEGAVR